jgi:hypothetical protein
VRGGFPRVCMGVNMCGEFSGEGGWVGWELWRGVWKPNACLSPPSCSPPPLQRRASVLHMPQSRGRRSSTSNHMEGGPQAMQPMLPGMQPQGGAGPQVREMRGSRGGGERTGRWGRVRGRGRQLALDLHLLGLSRAHSVTHPSSPFSRPLFSFLPSLSPSLLSPSLLSPYLLSLPPLPPSFPLFRSQVQTSGLSSTALAAVAMAAGQSPNSFLANNSSNALNKVAGAGGTKEPSYAGAGPGANPEDMTPEQIEVRGQRERKW